MSQKWTFETLAQCDKATLEKILLNGKPPDIEKLNGYIYCGWNHEWIGKISGEKFKKGFYKRPPEAKPLTYDELVNENNNLFNGNGNILTVPVNLPGGN